MTDVINVFIPGKPVPQGSKRHVGKGVMVESAKDLGPWRERVAMISHNAMVGNKRTVLGGAVAVDLAFVMPRPASTPKRTPHAIKRPDIDKLSRAILDALTHNVFSDDSQVVQLRATKRLAAVDETPGVHIRVAAVVQE